MMTTDITEGPGSVDGFVMLPQVEPGQGYFLMIDNWQGTQNGFVLTWTSSAAEYFDCDALVPCEVVALAGPDIVACRGDQTPIALNGTSFGNLGTETYKWSGTNGGSDFLSNPDIASPLIQLPVDFTGGINYTLTVTEDSCTSRDNLIVEVASTDISINTIGPFCESESFQIRTADPIGGTWGGSANGNVFHPMAQGPGTHFVSLYLR